MNLRNLSTVKERREAVEAECRVPLPNIGSFTLDEAIASTRNCENMVGAAQIPLGIAGPLAISPLTSHVLTSYYLPLATTEGALVASINRGCKAITAAEGAVVSSERVGTTRGPVFRTSSLAGSLTLKRWITEHTELLNMTAQQTSAHISLLSTLVQI